MILARNSITLHHLRDITTVVWYYKLQASTASPPAKPTTATPSGWTTTEPSYTEGSTNSLYVVQKTTFSDGTFEYSDVSLSTSYEAAKAAYNKSVQAQTTANAAQESIDNLEIGGRNLIYNSATMPFEPNGLKGWRASGGTVVHVELTDPPIHNLTGAIRVTNNGSAAARIGMAQDKLKNKFITGERYTQSCWIRGSENLKASLQPIWAASGQTTGNSYTFMDYFDITTEWTYIKWENALLSGDQAESYSGGYVYVQNVPVNGWFEVCGMKVEKGSKATDWTPAPEDLQADIDTLQPELIVGTHGTTATATWTGTSAVLTEIKAGTRIQYKLSSAGASNVTLNLTLKNGTTTGAKNVYFLNTTRLGTQYGINATIDLIYDGSAWRVLNPYTNSNTVGTYGGAVKAGTNGVKNYSLVMRDTETTWVSLTTTAGTGTSKSRYTGKLYPDKVMYMGSNSAYASGATTGTCYEALGVNLQYSTNCGSTLTSGRAVYLVGTLDSDGLFTLDATWWTQTIPTTADGKTYIYLGLAYSTTSIYLVPENTLYQYFEGAFRTLREIEEMKAAKVADNYLSSDNTGIMVADMTDGNTYTPSNVPSGTKNTFIDEDSFQVRDGTDVLASFGETTQIGKDDTNHQVIDAAGIQGVNANSVPVFDISMDGANRTTLIRNEVWNSEHINSNPKSITITYGPAIGSTTLLPVGDVQYAYRLEITKSDGTKETSNGRVDFGIVNVGENVQKTVETGTGWRVRVTYQFVNEVSFNTQVEINTTGIDTSAEPYVMSIKFTIRYRYVYSVIPSPAFTLGTRFGTPGAFSGAIGENLSTQYDNAFACGKNNIDNEDYAFMVGNGSGSSETETSNAFAVTWDGNQLFALDGDAASGTDAELYSAITALGWEEDVFL